MISQIDTLTFFPQVFWLVIFFFINYLLMVSVFIPKIFNAIQFRNFYLKVLKNNALRGYLLFNFYNFYGYLLLNKFLNNIVYISVNFLNSFFCVFLKIFELNLKNIDYYRKKLL